MLMCLNLAKGCFCYCRSFTEKNRLNVGIDDYDDETAAVVVAASAADGGDGGGGGGYDREAFELCITCCFTATTLEASALMHRIIHHSRDTVV